MAEHRAVAGDEHGRPAPAFYTDRPVANGVDASMHDVQPCGADTVVDGGRADPEGEQLSACDDTPLPRGQCGDALFPVEFAAHCAV